MLVHNCETKLLARFNSVESLIEVASPLSKIKNAIQKEISGNIDDIFNGLAKQYNANIQTVGKETFFKAGNVRVGIHK